MATRITPGELGDQLSDILKRVRDDGEDFIIEKDGEELARLTPPSSQGATWETLVDIFEQFPPDPQFADDLEAIHRAQSPTPPDPWQIS